MTADQHPSDVTRAMRHPQDQDSQAVLVEFLYRRGRARAGQLVRAPLDASAAVQEALAAVFLEDRLPRMADRRDLERFFFTVVRNRCLDQMRKRQPQTLDGTDTRPADTPAPDDLLSRQEARACSDVQRCFDEFRATLNTVDAEILHLRFVAEARPRDVAKQLSVPVARVYKVTDKLRRAMRHLQP